MGYMTAIKIKALAPTDTKGFRYSVSFAGKRFIEGRDYSLNEADDIAHKVFSFVKKHNMRGYYSIGQTEDGNFVAVASATPCTECVVEMAGGSNLRAVMG